MSFFDGAFQTSSLSAVDAAAAELASLWLPNNVPLLVTPNKSPELAGDALHSGNEMPDLEALTQLVMFDAPACGDGDATRPSTAGGDQADFGPVSDPSNEVHACLWKNCSETFNAVKDLGLHIVREHVKSGRSSYTCGWQDCSRKCVPFAKRVKIVNHIKTHTHERPFVCHCGRAFARNDSLLVHQRSRHDKPTSANQLRCVTCGKNYQHARSLQKHLSAEHGVFVSSRTLTSPISTAATLSDVSSIAATSPLADMFPSPASDHRSLAASPTSSTFVLLADAESPATTHYGDLLSPHPLRMVRSPTAASFWMVPSLTDSPVSDAFSTDPMISELASPTSPDFGLPLRGSVSPPKSLRETPYTRPATASPLLSLEQLNRNIAMLRKYRGQLTSKPAAV